MAPDRILFIRNFVESARDIARQTDKPLTHVLAEIRNAIFTDEQSTSNTDSFTADQSGSGGNGLFEPVQIMALSPGNDVLGFAYRRGHSTGACV
jgi:hypothetical protein